MQQNKKGTKIHKIKIIKRMRFSEILRFNIILAKNCN